MAATKTTKKKSTPKLARPLVPQVWTDWSVGQVRTALRMHEQGDFSLSAVLADHLRRDDRIFAALDSRVLGVLGLPFTLDLSEDHGDEEFCKTVRDDASRWWWRAFPEAVAADVERTVQIMGFALGEATMARDASDQLRPAIHVHHLANLRWNELEERYQLQTLNGREDVTPGDGRWILFAPSGVQRPWMNGAIRALAIPFLIRTFARRDWARRSEIDGVGVRKAKVPKIDDDKLIDQFLRDVQRLGAETTIRLPEGFDFELAVTESSAADGFQKLVNHCDSAITLALLGQNLTTQIEAGSFAAAQTHARVLLARLASDVATLASVLRDQLLTPWGRLNYPEWNDDAAPWPRWNHLPATDIQAEATALISVSQALVGLKGLGVDIVPLVEKFGLKLSSEATAKLPEIFAYHIAAGIPTVNEVRQRLQLPPSPDGDKPTSAPNAKPAEPAAAE